MTSSTPRSGLLGRIPFCSGRRRSGHGVEPDPVRDDEPVAVQLPAVGGPVPVAWREGTLTRAQELEALSAWVTRRGIGKRDEVLATAIKHHLDAAREAAAAKALDPRRRLRMFRNGPLIERARSNIDAAEAHLLNLATPEYVLGELPSMLRHVRSHLPPADPRRQELEAIAARLGIKDPGSPRLPRGDAPSQAEQLRIVKEEQGRMAAVVRGASSAALREHVRLRSFRNVVVVTATLMTLLAIGVAITGFFRPALIPLCFAPEEAGQAIVVCPTAQSEPFVPEGDQPQTDVPMRDIDEVVRETVSAQDLIVVELVGLTAAAVASAAAIRRIKGSSERYGLPVSLAALKLPTGAITAFLGLLLMRGQFVPGLTALDTSAQVLAWALVFGYAQQLFTRLVDQQGQTVLESVRPTDRAQPVPTPA